MEINKELFDKLFKEAMASERKRMNYDLRTSEEDGSQRMLNALLPGTEVAIHKHPNSSESIMCLTGDLDVVLYEEKSKDEMVYDVDGFAMTHRRVLVEKERIHLCPDFLTLTDRSSSFSPQQSSKAVLALHSARRQFGCTVPKDTWHTVDVHLPSVIFEAKDGKYGEDGSENFQ